MNDLTDYTNPASIDTDIVRSEINNAFRVRGHTWTDRLSWPNVTVKALADRITELEAALEDDGHRACIRAFKQRDREIDRLRRHITELEAAIRKHRHLKGRLTSRVDEALYEHLGEHP